MCACTCKRACCCCLFSNRSFLLPLCHSVQCAKPHRGLRGQVCRTRPLARRSLLHWTPGHTCAQVSRRTPPCSSRVFSSLALARLSPVQGPRGWAGVPHRATFPPAAGSGRRNPPCTLFDAAVCREVSRPAESALHDHFLPAPFLPPWVWRPVKESLKSACSYRPAARRYSCAY